MGLDSGVGGVGRCGTNVFTASHGSEQAAPKRAALVSARSAMSVAHIALSRPQRPPAPRSMAANWTMLALEKSPLAATLQLSDLRAAPSGSPPPPETKQCRPANPVVQGLERAGSLAKESLKPLKATHLVNPFDWALHKKENVQRWHSTVSAASSIDRIGNIFEPEQWLFNRKQNTTLTTSTVGSLTAPVREGTPGQRAGAVGWYSLSLMAGMGMTRLGAASDVAEVEETIGTPAAEVEPDSLTKASPPANLQPMPAPPIAAVRRPLLDVFASVAPGSGSDVGAAGTSSSAWLRATYQDIASNPEVRRLTIDNWREARTTAGNPPSEDQLLDDFHRNFGRNPSSMSPREFENYRRMLNFTLKKAEDDGRVISGKYGMPYTAPRFVPTDDSPFPPLPDLSGGNSISKQQLLDTLRAHRHFEQDPFMNSVLQAVDNGELDLSLMNSRESLKTSADADNLHTGVANALKYTQYNGVPAIEIFTNRTDSLSEMAMAFGHEFEHTDIGWNLANNWGIKIGDGEARAYGKELGIQDRLGLAHPTFDSPVGSGAPRTSKIFDFVAAKYKYANIQITSP